MLLFLKILDSKIASIDKDIAAEVEKLTKELQPQRTDKDGNVLIEEETVENAGVRLKSKLPQLQKIKDDYLEQKRNTDAAYNDFFSQKEQQKAFNDRLKAADELEAGVNSDASQERQQAVLDFFGRLRDKGYEIPDNIKDINDLLKKPIFH